uniref:Uncharacterized protein LOC100185395 n=1 Tax=Phallusia mammillata TaxID=59560 RepID=A0A6F9DJ47_9ASCI|nr:uncharacterized protein LOC100185395 [Phallusia mammillata]
MHHVFLVFAAFLAVGIPICSTLQLGAKCGKDGRWVGWFNADSPIGDGDFETLPNIRKAYGSQGCDKPQDIKVRMVTSKGSRKPTEVIFFGVEFGMQCLVKDNNGTCKDYEIALCCPGVIGNPNVGRSHDGYECLLAKVLTENGILSFKHSLCGYFHCKTRSTKGMCRGIYSISCFVADNFQCTDPCDEKSEIAKTQADCGNYSHCRWENDTCKSNRFPVAALNNGNAGDFIEDATGVEVEPTVEGRLFGNNLGPVPPFPFPSGFPFPYQPPSFPDNCGINYNDPTSIDALIQPPINIPYCYRVPCSTSNPSLEVNRVACHNQPGCYFDLELYNLRSAAGYGVLSGVPVCHEVIRHKNFAKAAAATVTKTSKPWRGIHTNCLIQQNPDMFVQECCDGLQIMLYFQAPVKQLGWPGITELECKIMGGCYVNNLCYYPPSSNQIQLRAGEDPLIGPNPTGRDLYGQPQCLPFDPNGSASSILDSYHSCRMAGCLIWIPHSMRQKYAHTFVTLLRAMQYQLT